MSANPQRPDQRRSGSARHKARQHAVEILFESDLRETDPMTTLAERIVQAEPPVREFTETLVRGVAEQRQQIDRRIQARLSTGWTLRRMPRVDRVIAQLATYELGWQRTDAAVVISEAVELAAELSTDDSPAFLHGLLGKIAAAAHD